MKWVYRESEKQWKIGWGTRRVYESLVFPRHVFVMRGFALLHCFGAQSAQSAALHGLLLITR